MRVTRKDIVKLKQLDRIEFCQRQQNNLDIMSFIYVGISIILAAIGMATDNIEVQLPLLITSIIFFVMSIISFLAYYHIVNKIEKEYFKIGVK